MILLIMLLVILTTGDVATAFSIGLNLGEEKHKVFNKKNITPIAIIDSGLDKELYVGKIPMCEFGHYNFINGTASIGKDEFNHGTVIANIISENINSNKYCLLIFKVMGRDFLTNESISKGYIKALYWALKSRAKIINISMQSDPRSNEYFQEEETLLALATKRGIKVFISAGNQDIDFDKKCIIYPACYAIHNRDLIVVGSKTYKSNFLTPVSNCGKIVNVCTTGINKYSNRTGTSFSAPQVINNYLKLLEAKGGIDARNTVGFQWSWTSYIQKNVCAKVKRERPEFTNRTVQAYRRAGIKRCRQATKAEIVRRGKRFLPIHETSAKGFSSR